MRARWLSASLREKQAVVAGAVFLGLLLVYEIIWAPLADSVQSMREQIQSDQKLLVWMQESNQRIQQLGKQSQSVKPTSTASLLNLIQTEINNTSLADKVSQLQQADNDSVKLHLQKASFDSLIKWLTLLTQSHNISITQANITPSAAPGIVDADLKLQIYTHYT